MAEPALKSYEKGNVEPTQRLGELYLKEFRSIARNSLLQADERASWMHLAKAVGLWTLGIAAIAILPLEMYTLPLFLLVSYGLGMTLMIFQSIAHDCGHLAYFKNKKLNDTVGVLTSLPLLVNHFAWSDDHKAHHSKTNHIEGDPNKYHMTQDQIDQVQARFKNPFYFFYFWFYSVCAILQIGLIAVQIFGLPLRRFTTLYWSAERPHHSFWNLALMAGFVASIWMLLPSQVFVFGFVLPYLVYQVVWFMLGYFQHNLGDSRYFDEEEYSFIKGVTQSKNLDFGRFHNFFFSGLGDRHLEHHMFPTVPFYRLPSVAGQFSEEFRQGLVNHLPQKPARFYFDFFSDYYRNYRIVKVGDNYRKDFRFGTKKSYPFFLLTGFFFPVFVVLNHLKAKKAAAATQQVVQQSSVQE